MNDENILLRARISPAPPSTFWYAVFNFLVTVFISTGYFRHVDAAGPEWLLIALATISHYGSFWLLLGGLFFLLLKLVRKPLAFKIIASILVVALFIVFYLDRVIYGLFRYHINGLVLDVITEEALGESVRLGIWTIINATVVITALIASQVVYFRWVDRWARGLSLNAGRRFKVWTAVGVLAVFAVDKCIYAYGDLYNKTALVKYAKIFPLYLPLTIKDFAQKKLHIRLEQEDKFVFADDKTLLNYPLLGADACKRPAKPLNYIVIVLDSWRFDYRNKEMTPNIEKFASECWDYRNNYSGGNATRYGIFAILYGIHSTYWQSFLSERRGTVAIEALKKQGYAFRIISSTKLTFPEFRRTAFVDIADSINDELGGDRPAVRDERQGPDLFKFLDGKKKGQPFFSFMYFDCPHSPYDYTDAFAKFQPAAKAVNYMQVVNGTDITHINRYKNGLHYDDNLLGKIFEGLNKRGLMENTVIILTADHGEEFWESGYWGHTNAFTLQQCKVPLMVRYPGKKARVINEVTTNLDIVPTLMELSGCPQLEAKYTLGKSLLKPAPRDYWVVTGWHSCAVYTKDRIITYNTDFRRAPELVVRGYDYKPVPESSRKEELKKFRPILLKVLEEQRRFLK
jgi:membrane-anchored protein YejM (alkaline phosphatase superfamily)